jgi:hypothetical protein
MIGFAEDSGTAILEALDQRCETSAPDSFVFGPDGEYRLHVANDVDWRLRTYRMMHGIYNEMEWGKPDSSGLHFGIYDLLPDTVTLVVTASGRIAATMTVVFDSKLGLPDDATYGPELDLERMLGHRQAQIISFGVRREARGNREILGKLFNFVYLVARRVRGASHFVHTVVPHHVAFYRRHLLFEQIGGERFQKKTGAGVCLLTLPLSIPDEEITRPRPRGYYRYFLRPEEEPSGLAYLRATIRPISDEEVAYLLSRRPKVWEHASGEQRRFLGCSFRRPRQATNPL